MCAPLRSRLFLEFWEQFAIKRTKPALTKSSILDTYM